jgi:hypothetical protein
MNDERLPAFARLTRRREPDEDDPLQLGDGALSLDGLQAIYRNPGLPLPTRMRAMIAALPFESPKLLATAIINEGSFADLLDQRLKRIEQQRLIEAKPTNGDKIIEGNPVDAPSIPDRRFRRI